MRLPLPFNGSYPITQRFGMRPEVYARFGLPGHEGLDWGVPRGMPVLAVADGTVGLASTAGAYGKHYRLVHPWGESVYAHLDEMKVAQGAKVTAGQVIGFSGSTGNSEGPHLHFGLRVKPFIRDKKIDRWQGFCDPEPYFRPYRNPIGPHIVNGNGAMLPLLQRWQPAAITVLDPDPGFVAEVRARCPQTRIVGRIYRDDSEVADRINQAPVSAAQWMHELVLGHPAYKANAIDYWQVANEVCQKPWEAFVKLNACMTYWIGLADAAGYKCGLFTFSVGNPEAPVNDPGWWNHITPTLQRAAKAGHVLLIHEYGCCPDVSGPMDDGKPATAWYAQRYVNQVRPYLQARTIKVIVTEFGYDGLIGSREPTGWQKSGMTAEQYAGQLLEFGDRYGRYRDQVLGVCVYTWGSNSPWGSYDISGEVAERLTVEIAKSAEGEGEGDDGPPQPVPPQPETALAAAAAALAAGQAQQRLSLNTDAALQKAMVKVGYAPTSNEFGFAHEGQTFVGQWGERLRNLAVGPEKAAQAAHVFYCPVGQWDNVSHVAALAAPLAAAPVAALREEHA